MQKRLQSGPKDMKKAPHGGPLTPILTLMDPTWAPSYQRSHFGPPPSTLFRYPLGATFEHFWHMVPIFVEAFFCYLLKPLVCTLWPASEP